MYSRRSVLGVRTRRAPEDKRRAAHTSLIRARKEVLDHAYAFASRGNISGAVAHIEAYARTEADPLAAEIWLFQEMTIWADPHAALVLGRELPDRLTAAGREAEATKVATMRDFLAERVMRDDPEA